MRNDIKISLYIILIIIIGALLFWAGRCTNNGEYNKLRNIVDITRTENEKFECINRRLEEENRKLEEERNRIKSAYDKLIQEIERIRNSIQNDIRGISRATGELLETNKDAIKLIRIIKYQAIQNK